MSDFTPISNNLHILNNAEKPKSIQKEKVELSESNQISDSNIVDIYQPAIKDNVNTNSSMLYNGILKQLKEQTLEMLKTGIPGSIETNYADKTVEGLTEFFKAEPSAIKEVQKGEVPEYWNVENTGRRIVEIALAGYSEGKDRVEFYDRAKALISGAYTDVQKMMVYEFPELVQDTRNAIFDALEQFLNGASLDELSFNTPPEKSAEEKEN